MIRIIAHTEDGDIAFEPRQTPKRIGLFGVVKQDYDQAWIQDDGSIITEKSRPSRNNADDSIRGLPATARFIVANSIRDNISLHQDLQLWMHGLCRQRIPGTSEAEAKKSWGSLTSGSGMSARFYTDFAGSDTHADYVNGNNLDKEPMKGKPLVTGGTILKIIGERRVAGTNCHVVEAINPTGNYRQYNPRDHWWLFFYPTVSAREQVRDAESKLLYFLEYISEPFPQYKNKTVMPVFAMAGENENYIPKSRVKILGEYDALPSPFVNSTVTGSETYFYTNPYL
ncbi:MAG: hypothetical protein Q8L41_10345 [Anaerolineales bacterium]|nr:hypothetical protein [Anaerolineales bacterium]